MASRGSPNSDVTCATLSPFLLAGCLPQWREELKAALGRFYPSRAGLEALHSPRPHPGLPRFPLLSNSPPWGCRPHHD